VITNTYASRAGRGLLVPGAFPRAGAWPAARIDGANGARGASRVNVAATVRPTATTPFLGQPLAQPEHMYMDKARKDAGKGDATGSQPRRAPV
jgi:hypothetical protein